MCFLIINKNEKMKTLVVFLTNYSFIIIHYSFYLINYHFRAKIFLNLLLLFITNVSKKFATAKLKNAK